MTRIYVVVEGQTEASFIDNVLAPEFWPAGKYLIPVILGVPGHKGGNTSYVRVKRDIVTLLKQDKAAYCSTQLDVYGLGPGFPGTPLKSRFTGIQKAWAIEQAMFQDVVASVDDTLKPSVRFIPYLQLHEYEALLFSDPAAFATAIRQQHLADDFVTIRNAFATPEDIDDNPNSAPSKRVLQLHPSYNKVLDGTLGAKGVGLASMRDECPHFREWVERLEAL